MLEVVASPPATDGTAKAAGITRDEWASAAELVQAAQRVLICAHKKPDGDAIGSLLGLGHALESAGRRVTLACADPAPDDLALLPGAQRIVTDLQPISAPNGPVPWDVIVTVDASDIDRLGTIYEANRPLFDRLPVVNLDHHQTNTRFGTANLVDPHAASATEVVTLFLEHLGIRPTVPAATCLLAGMMTDSLSFQTESTTARTLRVAATLVEAGAPLPALAAHLFRRRSLGSALVWSKALGTLQFAAQGRIAWLEVTREMMESSGPGADSGGLSGFAGSIAGVVIGAVIEEIEDGAISVSLRSPTVDVAQVAAQFGGGGHQRAAGCQFPAPATIAEVRTQLLPALAASLASSASG
ncbi:MAG: DHH family phosphoesterase [Chloroflexota bacterium]